jgi:hypothetical protein
MRRWAAIGVFAGVTTLAGCGGSVAAGTSPVLLGFAGPSPAVQKCINLESGHNFLSDADLHATAVKMVYAWDHKYTAAERTRAVRYCVAHPVTP